MNIGSRMRRLISLHIRPARVNSSRRSILHFLHMISRCMNPASSERGLMEARAAWEQAVAHGFRLVSD
eukprot:4159239-Pyramimonas_sp.AAC.1